MANGIVVTESLSPREGERQVMPTLPTGTVTLLFTDIAGSTQLWQDYPETMPVALARHNALMRAAIEGSAGYVVKTVGDAFMAVFPTALDGVQAAMQAQIALSAEPWPVDTPIYVRMALHTGVCDERENDYFGHEVNRTARILGVAHPQQVVLSQTVADLIASQLPESVMLLDLGPHLLKDLRTPEHLWQLCHPKLPSTFPPLASVNHWPNNLPVQLTSFIGRAAEIQEVKALLARSRNLTILGAGGSGKTRLALQTAVEVVQDYPDGVWFVELASVSDPSLVPQTVAMLFGLRPDPGRSLTQSLSNYFASRTLLLLLDNCEHLIEACARLTDTLLKACPKLRILTTSRERLAIPAEQMWRIPTLSLPPPQSALLPDNTEHGSADWGDALTLFVERARLQRPDFELTEQNITLAVEICRQLEGIPLAIELAAARIRVLSIEQVCERLKDRFKLLTGGSRTGQSRHQTLRATLDWSFDLLDARERALFARLSVFAGGWTLEACERICAGEEIEEWDILDLLTALVDKSLVMAEERNGAERYHLLETVRQYAQEKLSDADLYERKHRDYFLNLAENARKQISGPTGPDILSLLETEHDNLRKAMDFSLQAEDGAEEGLRLPVALHLFWQIRGYITEGQERLERALAHPQAHRHILSRADALCAIGHSALDQSNIPTARQSCNESLALYRSLGDKKGIGWALSVMGQVALAEGDVAAARACYEESLPLLREVGDAWRITSNLTFLGTVFHVMGDLDQARACFEEGLALALEIGDGQSYGFNLSNLADVLVKQGDYAQAFAHYSEVLHIAIRLKHRMATAHLLQAFGDVAVGRKQFQRAARLYGASSALHAQLGSQMLPFARPAYEQRMAILHAALSPDTFQEEWSAGEALTFEQATEFALHTEPS
ncbi:MAG TPA: tetratricopeptide repeat protein [Chthonomonadaceae bacterium]|nr:tetratricopeptide repeat protein [Chthonomonadaceae bacterium]